jgi:hypothetical protein
MKEHIDKIREQLDLIEKLEKTEEETQFVRNFDAFEIPSIICSIVDYLIPALSPMEGAVYFYLFRHSIMENGQQHLRTSVNTLLTITSSHHKEKENLSPHSVKTALRGLQEIGAITAAGDTNHDGSLYKINLPDEIPLCLEKMKSQEISKNAPVNEAKELDFYNIAENRLKVFERDSYKCHYCKKQLTRFSATLDHIQPVSKGGDNSYNNLITACLHCNSERGNKPIMDFVTK